MHDKNSDIFSVLRNGISNVIEPSTRAKEIFSSVFKMLSPLYSGVKVSAPWKRSGGEFVACGSISDVSSICKIVYSSDHMKLTAGRENFRFTWKLCDEYEIRKDILTIIKIENWKLHSICCTTMSSADT